MIDDHEEEFEEDECFDMEEFPLGLFTLTIDDETLKQMEETVIPTTPEMSELAEANVLKVLKEINKE